MKKRNGCHIASEKFEAADKQMEDVLSRLDHVNTRLRKDPKKGRRRRKINTRDLPDLKLLVMEK